METLAIKKIIKDDKVKILFLGAVHGNEKCGTWAIEKVIKMFENKTLELLKGTVTFMPICNPLAYAQNERDVGVNLNRIIKKYDSFAGSEEYFANQISLEIEKNDMVIDIHSSRNEDDKPCVFLDYENEGNISLSDATTIKFILKGYPAAFNKNGKYENYCTQSYADSQGKNCILIECGYHNHQSTYDLAFENIINILAKLGMIKAQAKDVEKTYILIEKMFIKQKKAEFTKKYKHLDKINKGETITIFEDGEKIVVPKDGYIILPNATAKIGDEWFELGFEE